MENEKNTKTRKFDKYEYDWQQRITVHLDRCIIWCAVNFVLIFASFIYLLATR